QEFRDLRAEHRPEAGNPSGIHRADRYAVIAMLTRNDLDLARFALAVEKEARCFDSTVIGITAARREKEMIDGWIAELRQLLRQLNRRNIRVADVRRRECQLLHLTHRCLSEFFPTMP